MIDWNVYPDHLRPSEPPTPLEECEAVCAVTGKRFNFDDWGVKVVAICRDIWLSCDLWGVTEYPKEGPPAEVLFNNEGWALIPQSFKKYPQVQGFPEEFFEDKG